MTARNVANASAERKGVAVFLPELNHVDTIAQLGRPARPARRCPEASGIFCSEFVAVSCGKRDRSVTGGKRNQYVTAPITTISFRSPMRVLTPESRFRSRLNVNRATDFRVIQSLLIKLIVLHERFTR